MSTILLLTCGILAIIAGLFAAIKVVSAGKKFDELYDEYK